MLRVLLLSIPAGLIGVTVMATCVAASHADESVESWDVSAKAA
jgi:hypothetical protein